MLPAVVRTLLWRALALAMLALALVGVVLPGLPTVPFLIASAWAAGKGWPALERWVLAHPRFGPPVHEWRERGAVPRRAKIAASAMMSLSALILLLSSIALGWALAIIAFMATVATWLWRRPE